MNGIPLRGLRRRSQTRQSLGRKQTSRDIAVAGCRFVILLAGSDRFIVPVLDFAGICGGVRFEIDRDLAVAGFENSEVENIARDLDQAHDYGDDARRQQDAFGSRCQLRAQRYVVCFSRRFGTCVAVFWILACSLSSATGRRDEARLRTGCGNAGARSSKRSFRYRDTHAQPHSIQADRNQAQAADPHASRVRS